MALFQNYILLSTERVPFFGISTKYLMMGIRNDSRTILNKEFSWLNKRNKTHIFTLHAARFARGFCVARCGNQKLCCIRS